MTAPISDVIFKLVRQVGDSGAMGATDYSSSQAAGHETVDRKRGGRALRIEGRLGGFLFLAGAVLCALAAVIPHPTSLDVAGFLWLSGAQLILAGFLFGATRAKFSARWLRLSTLLGAIVAVSSAVYLNGERDGGPALMNEFFYVWPAVYAGYFYSRWTISAVLAGIVGAYCAVLALIGAGADVFLFRLMVTISVVGGAAATAHVLRLQVNGLLARLRQLATTDALTSLVNRRGFDDRLRSELLRSERHGEPLALVLGDVDRFKALNDRFGHPCGDEVLAEIGRVLLESSRAVDVVARIGGEEFGLLLPRTSEARAYEVAERLREQIATVRTPDGEPVRMSFGVVIAPPGRPDAGKAMLDRSDLALYAAKNQGRDRTVVFGKHLLEMPNRVIAPTS